MPNILAYAALIFWPVAAYALFRALPLERALIWSILGGYLLLPPVANFDFPLIPPLDKTSIPNLAAFIIVVFILGRGATILSGSLLTRTLILLFLASPIATTLLNRQPFLVGPTLIPGIPVSDALATFIKQGLTLLPLFLARRHLATPAAQREILLALAVGGLAYSLPMLLEIRLSPQLNVWIYGFFPHAFDQQIRMGGFRPVVFLSHGLYVAFFALTTVIAAFGLWRAEKGPFLLAGAYLTGVLVLCKTLGALVYAGVAVPVTLLAGRRMQFAVAAGIAAVVLSYPILRGSGLVPIEAILEQAATVEQDRADSLAFRLSNEVEVLTHAQERPFFGWGAFGRNMARDPETGLTSTVLDGRWIIVISQFGWVGYIAEFGLLALPVFLLLMRSLRIPAQEISPYAGPVALILVFNLFDLLPNSPLTPMTWLLAGALLGHAESRTAQSAAPDPARPRRKPIETIL